MNQTGVFPIRDASQIAVARRGAESLAQIAGMDEQRISTINISVVELANNLLQHAGGGDIYIRYLSSIGAFDITAIDKGPGMPNVELCITDGYSTGSGTPGLGLGAVGRFAKQFNVFSIPMRATIASARMSRKDEIELDYSVVSTPIAGETLSGDGWCVSQNGRKFLVVDGLGHGAFANDAARSAIQAFSASEAESPAVILERMHKALRSTRGAAVAVAEVDPAVQKIHFAGVGNIAAYTLNKSRSQNFISHNGTVGHQVRRIQQFEYNYALGDLLIMQSDGLSTHSKSALPPLLIDEPPSVVAPFIYAEQLRGRDDATILAVRL